MNKYSSEDYYSVIEIKTGRKICDCADEQDALMMISFDPANRTITKNQFLMGQVWDIEIPKQLPTSEIVPVQPRSPKKLKRYQNKLQESTLEKFSA
jgi:hypothetical protein